MRARRAAKQSPERKAIRYDESNHCWIYSLEKDAYLLQTSMRDREGEYMWELYASAIHFEDFDDWMPCRSKQEEVQ